MDRRDFSESGKGFRCCHPIVGTATARRLWPADGGPEDTCLRAL